jgi:hypothetical protein
MANMSAFLHQGDRDAVFADPDIAQAGERVGWRLCSRIREIARAGAKKNGQQPVGIAASPSRAVASEASGRLAIADRKAHELVLRIASAGSRSWAVPYVTKLALEIDSSRATTPLPMTSAKGTGHHKQPEIVEPNRARSPRSVTDITSTSLASGAIS